MSDLWVEVDAPPSGDLSARRPAPPELLLARTTEIADAVATVADRFRTRMDERLRRSGDATGGSPGDGPPAGDAAPGDTGAGREGFRPEEIELSFQFSLQAEGGVVIKAGGSATFEVRVVWRA
ncbi:hypothetical protein AB0O01_07225 [Streptomyces sp. NPDC093252]|uniref:hypothetical protein n=1 Tax=Streptomyces sp. NPDC093252 TaxID=3154980 RepID=UPI003419797A